MKTRIAVLALFWAVQGMAQTFDFFKIQSVKYVDAMPVKGGEIFRNTFKKDAQNRMIFSPYLEVAVRVGERTQSGTVYAKVYYYNKDKVLIDKAEKPTPVMRTSEKPHPMPVFFEKNKTDMLYFIVPEKVLATPDWRAVAVFGDALAAVAAMSPNGFPKMYDFPERGQVDNPTRARREVAADPVVETVVKTGNAAHPQLTLFMRPPIGMTDMSEAEGVLAMCLLANDVGEVKRRLQEVNAGDEVGELLRFAEKRKLVILCWGSRSLWDGGKNWDELDKDALKQADDIFNVMAAAWAKGVEGFSRRYGMPDKGFLLWGFSASAQYAKRLALRKPQYFLAAHIHISSSYDKPTPDAAQVLWCLTTGESDGGYERSLRFFAECRRMGYPILYKAIPGLGHQGHPVTDRLGLAFFDYALSLRGEKRDYEESAPKASLSKNVQNARPPGPWPVSFREPEFIGDVVNQQVLPASEAAAHIPEAFRVAIPTKALADIWQMEK